MKISKPVVCPECRGKYFASANGRDHPCFTCNGEGKVTEAQVKIFKDRAKDYEDYLKKVKNEKNT